MPAMSRKQVGAGLFLLAGLVAVGLYVGRGESARTRPGPGTSLAEIRKQVPMPEKRIAEIPKQDIPAECLNSWSLMLRLDLNAWYDRLATGAAERDPRCAAWERGQVPTAWGGYPDEVCFEPDLIRTYREQGSEVQDPKRTAALQNCINSLTFYRAWVLHRATAHLAPDSLSPAVLSNKIMARFFEMGTDPKAAADIRAWNALLKGDNPNLYASYKLDLVMEFASDETAGGVSKVVQEIRERFPTPDPEVEASEIVDSIRKNDWENVPEKIDQAAEAHPEDPRWEYFRGYVAWEARDRARATVHVNRALQQAPQNTDFKKTLASLQSAPLGTKHIFALTLGFRFDEL